MRKRTLLVVLILVMIGSTPLLGEQNSRPTLDETYTVVSNPLLEYTQDEFQELTVVRDLWNESFEQPLDSTNHYWYRAGQTVTEGTLKRNSTLDSGFEEVSSSSLNPNVNLPSWFIHRDNPDITVKTNRSDTIKYDQSYSAYVETRYINTTTEVSYEWRTPYSSFNQCGGQPFYTWDDNPGTEWTEKTNERHYVTYDMGQSYIVKNIRVYCGSNRLDDVDIYVSDSSLYMGSKVIELWDPVNTSGWSVSPSFMKQGRYVKIEFGTTHFKNNIDDAFYEFDAYVQVSGVSHQGGGLKCPQEYYYRTPYVYIYDTPIFETRIFLDDVGEGSGYSESFYILGDIEIQNDGIIQHIIYVIPITILGTPSQDHFSNTSNTKYIYNVTTIDTYDVWITFNKNVKNDYENIWGQVNNVTVSQITIKNDFYNAETESETDTPYIKTYYDAVSLKLSSLNNEEELPDGSFEAQGWEKLQENKLQFFNYTKESSDYYEGTSSYLMNITCDSSGGSGLDFNSTKHGIVAFDETSMIREINDTYNHRLHASVKLENFTITSNIVYSFVGIRLKFVNKTNPADIRYLYYCIMLYGDPPSDSDTEKYVELVKFYTLQEGIWYEVSRRPISDSGWENVKITQVALVAAFYYGVLYSSTDNDDVVVLYDEVGIDIEKEEEILIEDSLRSTEEVLDGSYSLKQNRITMGSQFDIYETGAENLNNTFYVAFPYYMNFSTYYYVSELLGDATIQISLAIDDGPTYGEGYLYELIYYYGSSSGVSPIFVSSPIEKVQISQSITTLSWINLQRNWTVEVPQSWPKTNPRVEAVCLRIWTANSITIYWDLAAFRGTWFGVEKTTQLQSVNEILINKFNTTEYWNVTGGLDPGIDDYVDNNVSDVDSTQNYGSHSNFPNQQGSPDFKRDVLTESYSDQYLEDLEDYVDNNVSDVDSYPDRGSQSNFPAEQSGPDSIYDNMEEEYLGSGVDIIDYVDNNVSDVDSSSSLGSHSNFTATQYGPDSSFDVLDEENTNPPPNDVTDYVDHNVSNVDSLSGYGSHSNFTATQYGPDSVIDELTEENTYPPLNDVIDYVDNNVSDVDSSPGFGSHNNFTATQYAPDSIYDTLTEEFTGSVTNSTEDYVDQVSDVDGIQDIGTHGNFTAEKYGPDSIYDILTEEATYDGNNGWTTPDSVNASCGEEGTSPAADTIDDKANTDWRHNFAELHWIIYDMGELTKINEVRIYSGTTPQQYTVEDITVYVSEDTTFDESEIVVTDWDVPKGGWDVSPSFSRIGRYIKLENINVTTPNGQLDKSFYEFDAWTEPLYEMDLEVQWSDVSYNETDEELCIYGGTQGVENLQVDVWNGSSWNNVISDLLTGWNNVSVSSYLTNSTFTVRFKGSEESEDITQDTYEIDAVLLHVWTSGISNYKLDLEVQWTNVDYDEVNEYLCIYTGDLTSETVKVDYWTGIGWSNLLTSLTANSWNNVSVNFVSSNFTIRFKGTDEIGDEAQDSWDLDAVLLHVWTDQQNYRLDLEVQWTNVDYDEVNEKLCIYTDDMMSEDLNVDVWTGSSWVNVFSNLSPNSWNNVSISDYLTSSTFTVRFRDSNPSGDADEDVWQIDAMVLQLFTLNITNYELDLEVQFTDISYDYENEELCIYASDTSQENVTVQVWYSLNWITLFQNVEANNWNNISVNDYLDSSTFTIRFKGSNETDDTFKDSYMIDAVLLHTWEIQGYQLDIEVQFTNADYNEENEYLCIYTGNLDSEDIVVDVYSGLEWITLLSDLEANSWNNVSVSQYLISPTFTIRFKDGYKANNDVEQDDWLIDTVLLHVWTFQGYLLDLEVQFTDVDIDYRAGELRVFSGQLGLEGLRVDYWTGYSWSTLIPSLTANDWSTALIPLNQSITIRFKGNIETDDFVQSNWEIDTVLLSTWYIYTSEDIGRANANSANQWYYKWWGTRRIYVINGTDTYELAGNSTEEGLLNFHDNEWISEDEVTTYNNDTSGYVIYNVTDFTVTEYGKNVEYEEYVEVRYVLFFCRPLGVFEYNSENKATAANEPDEYGEENWLTDFRDGQYYNYLVSNSSNTITYLPDF